MDEIWSYGITTMAVYIPRIHKPSIYLQPVADFLVFSAYFHL